jgi:hypothetical protein
MLRLAEMDVERLEELVTDAWRMRAPDALVGELGEADGLSRAQNWAERGLPELDVARVPLTWSSDWRCGRP